jgi:DNA primase
MVVDIEMMDINEELSNQELMDYMKQILNYDKIVEIKEKKLKQKEAERQQNYVEAAKIGMEVLLLEKSLK